MEHLIAVAAILAVATFAVGVAMPWAARRAESTAPPRGEVDGDGRGGHRRRR
jgi:hypothetical protein